jgi:hypothetical protein
VETAGPLDHPGDRRPERSHVGGLRFPRTGQPGRRTALDHRWDRRRPAPLAVRVRLLGSGTSTDEGFRMGSVIKKRRKRMAKKKHRKLLKKTRVQRRNKK